MRRALVMWMLLATTSMVAAEPRRAARPHAVTGGVTVLGAFGGDDVLPYLTAQGTVDLDRRFSAVADAGFFTSGDRVFGPRLLLRAGMRAYLRDGAANPYVSVVGALYHELDVDYEYSDASQQASTSLGLGATLGHELITAAGLTWTVEATVIELFGMSTRAADGHGWQLGTAIGYRF